MKAPAQSRPFAVFDIDGTVLRWQLFHAVVDKLAQQNLLGGSALSRIQTARNKWKTRQTEEAFMDYESVLVRLYQAALPNLSVAEVQAAQRDTFETYKDQVYRYTRRLIADLKTKNYLLFAISGSGSDIVNLFTTYHGFDDARGSHVEVVNGKFTGHINVARSARKAELLQELVATHNATYAGSIGVGDGEGDIPLLKMVECPIAFNPSKKLFLLARARGWQVVIERKNMTYELEWGHGHYVLKDESNA